MNTIEKNKNLVELIGRKGNINESLYTWKDIDKLLSGGWVPLEQMKFSTDWNWSMQVVEYIEKIGYQVDINSRLLPDKSAKDHWCTIWDDAHEVKVCEIGSDASKILAVHEACTHFAVWYKSQNTKS
jgi:hypothetical protein